MKTLKSITSILTLLLILTASAQGQNFYLSSDLGSNGQAFERIEAGLYVHTSEALNVSASWGYASRFNSGNYFTFGPTAEVLPQSLQFAAFGAEHQPVISLSMRGAIGEIPEGSHGRKDLSGGFAYSAFIGLDYGQFAAGVTLEQWVSNRDFIYVNPLSIKLKL